MSKVLEKATAHFRSRIGGEMRKITVPEWECDIWFKTSTNLKEQSKLIELSQAGKTVEALVENLVIKARNQDGTKMFGMPDKITLMNEVDPSVIIRVVAEMNDVSSEDFNQEQVEKN